MMVKAATSFGAPASSLGRHSRGSSVIAVTPERSRIARFFRAMHVRGDGPTGATKLGMRFNQFDAKVWGFVLMGCLLAATVGCFGLAAAAVQTSTTNGTDVISVSAALRKMEQTRIRQGVMTERVRNGQVEQLVPGALASDAVR
jgi:hypothetical protein